MSEPVNRWTEGIEHEEFSDYLVRLIAETDFDHFGDSGRWNVGGDGDNGETLMYVIDAILELGGNEVREELKKLLDKKVDLKAYSSVP